MYLAFMKVPHLHLATRWGDFSYGVYLYAFPVQQMVMSMERRQPRWMAFPLYVGICSAITLGLAMLSWFFVEKPMLKLKKKSFPLSPVLRGEGGAEGLNDKERNSAFRPSPQPSPLSTGERGSDTSNRAMGVP
jgi:peptidoglycan/LPS O-acetylase OafA/YrhL